MNFIYWYLIGTMNTEFTDYFNFHKTQNPPKPLHHPTTLHQLVPTQNPRFFHVFYFCWDDAPVMTITHYIIQAASRIFKFMIYEGTSRHFCHLNVFPEAELIGSCDCFMAHREDAIERFERVNVVMTTMRMEAMWGYGVFCLFCGIYWWF